MAENMTFADIVFDKLGDDDSEKASQAIISQAVAPATGPLRLFDWGVEVENMVMAKYMRLFSLEHALECDNNEVSMLFEQRLPDPDTDHPMVSTYATNGVYRGHNQTFSVQYWIPKSETSSQKFLEGRYRNDFSEPHDLMLDFAVRAAGSTLAPIVDANHHNWILGGKRENANVLLVTTLRVQIDTDSTSETQETGNVEQCGIIVDLFKEHPDPTGTGGKLLRMPNDKWPARTFVENLAGKPIQRGSNTLFADEAIPLSSGTHLLVRLKKPPAWKPKKFRVFIGGYEIYYQNEDKSTGLWTPGSLNLDGDVGRPTGASLNDDPGNPPYRHDDFREGVIKVS